MELFYNSNYLIIKRSQSSLWFKRYDNVSNYEFKIGYDFSNLDDSDLKCFGIAYTLIGSLTPDTLLFTVRNQFIGKIPDTNTDLNVYLIKKVALVNLNSDFDNLINEFDLCPVHDSQNEQEQNDINLSNLSTNLPNVNVQTMQKTWNSIKQNTPMIKITNIGQRINDEVLKLFNETDSFYYCENGDLTNNLQKKNSSQYLELVKQDLPFWRRADERFFFNRHLLNFLINNESSIDKTATWIQPIIQGFIEIVNCKSSLIEEPNSFNLILLSRRSRFRAGTRYKRRGVDENGKVANYVETEQILKFSQHVVSFVQVRGSIPVYWSQPGNAYRPTPILDRSLKESQIAFEKHFEEEFSIYGKVTAINLIERQGRESILGDAYLNCLLDFNNEKLSYVVFDFHSHCRGMKFSNVNLLIDNIQEQIKEQLFFWRDNNGVICKQTGVFRVNCVDCLDRTNLVQSSIAKFVLLTQMNKLALLAPDEPFNIRKVFQHIWANNGDCISRQYAGTSALKGDFTRTGERRISGIFHDSINSASRYLIRFKDSYRQAAIDTLLGNPIVDLNDLPDQNNNDAEEEEEDTERVKQIIEDVKMFCIPENEIILGSWSLISTISNEMDTILVLTKDNYYVVTYDEQRDRVSKCQCVSLEDIEKIELGPEQNSINQRHSYCIRIHYLFNSSTGYFHMFRSSNTRFFNNMVIMIKTSEDSIESLRSIVESFKIALSVKNISVPLFEGKLIPKKSKKPQAVYFARKINQQIQKLPRNISDNNLLRIKNVGRNVSTQFARFKNKFTGSTRSNINLPGDTVFESTINSSIDLRNNSYTSLSILKEDDNTDYVKTSLKPRLTDPSSITSTSSINALQYATEEDERTATLSESGLSSEDDEELDDSEIYQNDNEEYSKAQDITNDTILESCGILTTTSTNKQQKRPKSELSNYTKTLSQVDDFVFDSMKKTLNCQMLNQVKRKVNSPQIQITNQNDFNSSDYFLSSDSSVNFSHKNQNAVSCANLNSPMVIVDESCGIGNLNRRLSDENETASSTNKKNELTKNLNNEDCSRSTFDIYGSNKKRQNNSFSTFTNTFSTNNLDGNLRSLLKSSKSEANDISDQLNLSKIIPSIGKRDLIFNPLNKITSFAKGMQNIGIISSNRRFNKTLLSNEELEILEEKKNKSKSLIIEIN